MKEQARAQKRPDTKWLIKHSIGGGLIAGAVFILIEMIAALAATGQAFGPLRMIAGIPLRQQPETIDLLTAVVSGSLFHFALSVALALIATYLIYTRADFIKSPGKLITFSSLMGFGYWVVNFFIIAPLLSAPWFLTQTDLFQQFLFHTFAFGTILGVYLAAKTPRFKRRSS